MEITLTAKEKKEVLENRLKNLSFDVHTDGIVLNIRKALNSNICDLYVTMSDEINEKAICLTLKENEIKSLYEFLKTRYLYSQEVRNLNNIEKK